MSLNRNSMTAAWAICIFFAAFCAASTPTTRPAPKPLSDNVKSGLAYLVRTQQPSGGLRELQPDGRVELPELAQARVLAVLSRVAQALLQLRGPRMIVGCLHIHSARANLQQRGVDAVHAGAGHHPQVERHDETDPTVMPTTGSTAPAPDPATVTAHHGR